jgi:hypothetical protein
MKVAWHEMPGKHPRGTRPVGYGMIGFNIGARASRVGLIVFEDPRIPRRSAKFTFAL